MNRYDRRAELTDVKYIVIHGTMTPPSIDGKTKEAERQGISPRMLGQHFYIHRDAEIEPMVPLNKRGTAMPRYVEDSVVITVEGGITEEGEYAISSYTLAQLEAVKRCLDISAKFYPDAEVLLWCDLKLGVNPSFTLEDLSNLPKIN